MEHLNTNDDILEKYNRFASSKYGKTLECRTRFDDFRPEWVDTELWCKLLGDDVNNLRHMLYTYKIAKRFSELECLDYVSAAHLLGIAAVHDWGEALVGDISLIAKTHDDEILEERAFRAIASDLYGDSEGSSISESVWLTMGQDCRIGDMFKAIEYIGYCTTAMRAGYVADAISHGLIILDVTRKEEMDLAGGLMAMEKAVQVRSYPILEEYIKKYPSIERIILDGIK